MSGATSTSSAASGGGSGGAGGASSAEGGGGELAPLAITEASLPAGHVGTNYVATLHATGAAEPYAWTTVSGSLPKGLTLKPNGAELTIEGMPTEAGTSSCTIAVDAQGMTAANRYTIVVSDAVWVAYTDGTAGSIVDVGGAAPSTPSPLMSGNANLTWSPDGGWLASTKYSGIGIIHDLFVHEVGPLGLAKQVAVDSPPIWGKPVWSPDGQRLAFLAGDPKKGTTAEEALLDLYVVDVSGGAPSSPVRVSGSNQVVGLTVDFKWSPDSKLLAYHQEAGAYLHTVHVVPANAAGPGSAVTANAPLASTATANSYVWGSDSKRLYYGVHDIFAPAFQAQDGIFHVDLSGVTPVVTHVGPILKKEGEVAGYAPSPTSSQLVFATDAAYWIDASLGLPGQPQVMYSNSISVNGVFQWAPDGQKLIWNDRFVPVTANGPGAALLLGEQGFPLVTTIEIEGISRGRWSNDGHWFAYQAVTKDSFYIPPKVTAETFLLETNGMAAGTKHPIGNGVGGFCFSFSPTGNALAFAHGDKVLSVTNLAASPPTTLEASGGYQNVSAFSCAASTTQGTRHSWWLRDGSGLVFIDGGKTQVVLVKLSENQVPEPPVVLAEGALELTPQP